MGVAVWVAFVIVIVIIVVVPTVAAFLGVQETLALGQVSLLDTASATSAEYQQDHHEDNDKEAGSAADQSDHGYAYTRNLDSSIQKRLTPACRLPLGDRLWRT